MKRCQRANRASNGGRYPLDLDPADVPHGLRKVVRRLKAIPGICAASERLVQADRHFGRDARPAVDKFRKLLAANAQPPRRHNLSRGNKLVEMDPSYYYL